MSVGFFAFVLDYDSYFSSTLDGGWESDEQRRVLYLQYGVKRWGKNALFTFLDEGFKTATTASCIGLASKGDSQCGKDRTLAAYRPMFSTPHKALSIHTG